MYSAELQLSTSKMAKRYSAQRALELMDESEWNALEEHGEVEQEDISEDKDNVEVNSEFDSELEDELDSEPAAGRPPQPAAEGHPQPATRRPPQPAVRSVDPQRTPRHRLHAATATSTSVLYTQRSSVHHVFPKRTCPLTHMMFCSVTSSIYFSDILYFMNSD